MHTETHGGVPIGRVKTEKLRSNLTEIVTKLSSQAASRLSTPKKVPPPKVGPATPQAVSVTSKADATTPVSPTRTSTLEVLSESPLAIPTPPGSRLASPVKPRRGSPRLKSRTSLFEQEEYCSQCFLSLVQRPKNECNENSPSVLLCASKCSKAHDAEFHLEFAPTAKKQMSAFKDDFADAKDYISISFYLISREEPKSQWAEKKAHLYETTDSYVAEDVSDPNQLVELAKETIFGSELINSRLCKLMDAKDLFIVPRKFFRLLVTHQYIYNI
jgi:hypothetical protein